MSLIINKEDDLINFVMRLSYVTNIKRLEFELVADGLKPVLFLEAPQNPVYNTSIYTICLAKEDLQNYGSYG